MSASSPSPSGHRSWREGGARHATAGTRAAYRWVTTLLTIALLAAFAWYIWPRPRPCTHIVAVTNTGYDKTIVPPIRYSLEDIDGLRAIVSSRKAEDLILTHHRDLIGDDLLRVAAAGLGGRPSLRDDVLLLYVSAHGLAEDGTPYLLCSGDFAWEGPSRRLPVKALLERLGAREERLKLLVLDTGWIVSDPRLGMVVNEFPRLVAKDVREIADRRLWVLLSSSLFETCAVASSQRRSVFSQCFSDALQATADTDNDRQLSLAELYRYVLWGCRDWARRHAGAAQTPLLMQGGHGLRQPDEVPPEIRVAATTPRASPEGDGAAAQAEDAAADRGAGARLKVHGPAVVSPRAAPPAGLALAMAAAPNRPEGSDAEANPAASGSGDRAGRPQNGAAVSPPAKQPAAAVGTDRPEGAAEGATEGAAERAAEGPPASGTGAEVPPAERSGEPGDKRPTQDAGRPAERAADSGAADALTGEPDGEAVARMLLILGDAWDLCDELRGRPKLGDRTDWAPVDFAPHMWRELDEQLLAYERLARAGAVHDAGKREQELRHLGPLVAELQAIVDGLRDLARQLQKPDAARHLGDRQTQLVTHRLIDAWRACVGEGGAGARLESAVHNGDGVGNALRLSNDMTFLAPCYVRWHARASLVSSAGLAQTRLIRDFLDRLIDLHGALAARVEVAATGFRGRSPQGTALTGRVSDPSHPAMGRLVSTRSAAAASGTAADGTAASGNVAGGNARSGTAADESQRQAPDPTGLERTQRAMVDAWTRLEGSLREAREDACQAPGRPGNERRIEDQLNTLCLSAQDRRKLLSVLAGIAPGLPREETRWHDSEPGSVDLAVRPPRWEWDRLREQVGFQHALLCLAHGEDSAQARDIRDRWQSLGAQPGAGAAGGDHGESLWKAYRGVGVALKRYYAEMPREAEGRSPGAERSARSVADRRPRAAWGVWRLMCLADGRDALRFNDPQQVNVFAHMAGRPTPRLELEVSPAGRLVLDSTEWASVAVSVRWSEPTASKPNVGDESGLYLDFDPRRLEIRGDARRQTVRPGRQPDGVLQPNGANSLQYAVRWIRHQEDPDGRAAGTDLVVRIRGPDGNEKKTSIRCFPDEVELAVARVGATSVAQRPHAADTIALRPFPNRTTEFLFRLKNDSGAEKRVDVALLAVPGQPQATWPPGRLVRAPGQRFPGIEASIFPEAETGAIAKDITIVARTAQPMVLPADGSETLVEWVAGGGTGASQEKPGAGAEAAGARHEAGAEKGIRPPAEPPGPEVTHGLVCVIDDKPAEGRAKRWVKWLEIVPLAPPDYLQADCRYLGEGRIRTTVEPKGGDAGLLPADWRKNQISVACSTDRQSGERLGGVFRATMDVRETRATIWPTVDTSRQDRRTVTVYISVDGYPRGFAFRVPLNEALPADDGRAALRRVEIVTLAMAESERLFQTGQRAAFAPTDRPIMVTFEVDAPPNAFRWLDGDEGAAPTDAVELAVEAIPVGTRTQVRQFYADRHVVTRLAEVAPAGRLHLRAEVGDYREPIDASGLRNAEFLIRADLKLRDHRVESSTMAVVIDDEPPDVGVLDVDTDVRVAGAPPVGRIIRVRLRAADLSGIEKLDFDINERPLFEKAKFSVQGDGFTTAADGKTVTVDLRLGELAAGRYHLVVQATDRAANAGVSAPFPLVLPDPSADARSGPGAGPKNGVIRGLVGKGSFRPDGITVTLQGTGRSQVTQNGGQFTFADVPPGKYSILAKGPVSGVNREGQLDGVEPSPEGQPPKSVFIELGPTRR